MWQRFSEERERICLILGILIIGFFVFKDFFLLKNLYIYLDVGSDTYFSYWPYLTYLSEMIYSGSFSFWSFNIGIGSNLFSTNPMLTDPFSVIAALSGPKLLVYVLPYLALLKIMIAALAFFAYLKYIGINKYSSLIASLMYGFNGFIILWGQHYHMGTIIVFIPFVLLGFERWLKEKKVYLYIFSLFLIALSSYYFLYMFAIFFIMYVMVRYFETYKFEMKHFVVFIAKIALYSLISIGLSCVILLPSVYVALNNPRINGQIIGDGVLSFAGVSDYITIILRLFSNDILGTGNEFYGVGNYYEAPILYTGTLSLILVPMYFFYANKKNRIIYGILFFILFLFLLFPIFSQFFNAFSAYTYRWTFNIIFFISILNAKSLNYITSNNIKAKNQLLLHIFSFLMFISIVSLLIGDDVLNWSQFFTHSFKHLFVSLSLLLVYSFFIKRINSSFYKGTTIIFICVELALFSFTTVNRGMLSNESAISKTGYNDYTNEAVDYLNKIDNSFFRVDKDYNSVFLVDSLRQGYKGVKAYSSLNQPSYLKFLKEMEIPFKIDNHPNYITGLDSNTALSRLLGVKYLLVNNSTYPPNGYELLNQIENIKIYEDKYSLPLGFTYKNYISYEDFMKNNAQERSSILLKSFVSEKKLTDSMGYNKLPLSKVDKSISTIPIDKQDIELVNIELVDGELNTTLTFNTINNDPQIILPVAWSGEYNQKIKVSMNIDSNISSKGQIFIGEGNGFSEENSTTFSYNPGSTHYEHTFDYSGIRQMRIDISNTNGQFIISDFKIQSVKNELMSDVDHLKKNTLNVTQYSNDHIKGDITTKGSEMLFLSIPYDKGWKAKVNGKKVSIEKINIGFIGIPLDSGTHEIELSYEPPLLNVGIYITLFTLFSIMIFHFYRKKYRT